MLCHYIGRAVSSTGVLGILIRNAAWVLLVALNSMNAAHAAVGRTPGSFSVSSTGASTYTVPIWAPPGPGRVQPNIALAYNSQQGVGYLGVGWSLSGLSSIYRCNLTFAQDGAPAAIALATTDGLCIDGKRLRLISGTQGSAGSTYQTEIADFSNVTANGTAGNGPASFTVQARNGWTYEYGNDSNGANSQVLATGTSTASAWMLDKVTDRAGNTMTISYQEADQNSNLEGMTVPQTISWTPSAHGSSSYNYTMTFSYTTLSVPSTVGYVAGTLVQNAYLLTNIVVASSGTTVRNYVLSYTASATTSRETLQSIQECADSAATNCLAATTVAYQSGQAGVSTSATTGIGSTYGGVIAHYDFNHDGYTDLVYQMETVCYVAFGSAQGYGTPVILPNGCQLFGDLLGTGQDGILSPNGGTWYYYTWNGSSFSGVSTGLAYDASASQYGLADIDGDGLPDLVTVYSANTNVRIYTRLNTAGTTGSPGFSSAPVLAYQNTLSTTTGATLITPDTAYGPLRAWDFNGDGRGDLILLLGKHLGTVYSLSLNELLSSSGGTFSLALMGSASDAGYTPFVLNFNNDACTDFIWNGLLYVSGCDSAAASALPVTGQQVLAALDWNADGQTDLIVANGSTLGVMLSTASGLSSVVSTSVPYSSACQYLTFDANGDGLDDLGCMPTPGNSGAMTYYIHSGAGTPPDLLTSVTDGYGNYTQPTYKSMIEGMNSVYFPAVSSPSYPNRAFLSSLYLVSGETDSDPSTVAGTYTRSHFYSGATVNLQGRGFTGMLTHQMYDSRNSVWETWQYGVLFPYIGMLAQDTQTLNNTPASTIFLRVLTQNNSVLYTTPNEEVYFPYVSKDVVQNYEVGGPKNLQLIKTTSTNYTFDSYGNPTTITTTLTDEDSGSPVGPASPYYGDSWTTTTTNTTDPDPTHWCLNLYTESQVSYTASIGSAVTRTKQFVPDTTNCRYTQIVTEPNSSQYMVTEKLGYDPTAGTLLTDTVTGVGMTARTTTYVWDSESTFPTSITDPSGATSLLAFNYSYGVPASLTDPNGEKTTWSYDAFAREYRESRADGTVTSWSYALCTDCGSLVRMTIVQNQIDSAGGNIDSLTYYNDMLDRLLFQTGTEINGTTTWAARKTYDSLGRVVAESMPYAGSSSPGSVTYAYDIMNRVTEISRPISASNSTAQSTNYTYEGRTTITADALQNATTTVTDVNGRLRQTTDAHGYSVTLGYDAVGSKTSVTDSQGNTLWGNATYAYGVAPYLLGATDMDLGSWTYSYDALGEKTSWKDAKGQQFSQTYDALSRPLSRTEPDYFTQWTWGSSASSHNWGKLHSVCTGSGGACTSSGYSESETYDADARLSQRAITIPGTGTFTYTWQYSTTTGFLSTLTYPTSTSGCALELNYAYSYAILQSITAEICNSPNVTVWTANATDPAGHVIQETLGNGIQTNRAFDAVTGWLTSTESGVGGGAGVKNLAFLYDYMGNVTQRQDNKLGLTENLYYDSDYRLSTSKLNGSVSLSITYDPTGNIVSSSGIAGGATWTYDPVRKHAVTQAGNSSYQYAYDANGNMTSRQGSSIGWSSYNYPTAISATSGISGSTPETVAFSYGPGRQRWQQGYSGNGTTETTSYVGGLMEVVSSGGVTTYRHYIAGTGGSTVAIYSRNSSGVNAWNYALTDHQASVSAITNSTGGVTASESYTPYGARRNPTTWSGADSNADLAASAAITRQGYTGQTQLGLWMGLNHMNGRVEDSTTGRFLSADPRIPDPTNTQDYNRYSYVDNNPLTYIDPSGFDDEPMLSDGSGNDGASDDGDASDGDTSEVDISGTRPPVYSPPIIVGNFLALQTTPNTQSNADESTVTVKGHKPPPNSVSVPCLPGVSCVVPQGNQQPMSEVTVQANRMVPCDQLNGANDTIQPLLDAATKAYNEYPLRPIDMVWPLSALRGTYIHSYFAAEVAGLGAPYSAEVSYLGGVPVPYGTPGSIRADATVGPINAPLYAVELKSGAALPTPAETAAYRANLPPGAGLCSIVEGL